MLAVVDFFRLHIVAAHAVPGGLFPARARFAPVAVRVDGKAASRQELAPDLDIFGLHEADQILHDLVDDVRMKISVVAEREEVEFQRLAFHQLFVRHIGDGDRGKVRLTGDRTQAGKLRAVELDEIIIFRMLVAEGLQHLMVVGHLVFGLLASKLGQVFFFSHFISPFRSLVRFCVTDT